MKWKREQTPQLGDKRKVRKFAFLPKKCNEFTVWLETYESVQEYSRDFWYTPERRYADSWKEVARNELYYDYEG